MDGERSRPRRVTITDIAQRAGVSIGAVSFALNGRKGVSDETRARVMAVADELGWAPTSAARSLAESKTDTIGLILARDPYSFGVESFYMKFFAGIEIELSKRSFGLLLQIVGSLEDELATTKKWRNARRVDGLIAVDMRVDDPRLDIARAAGALPTVIVGAPKQADGLMSVGTDDAAGIAEAVEHLSTLGHRRIARVSGLPELLHTQIRDDAFREQIVAIGGEGVILPTDFSPQAGADATTELLSRQDPVTAIVYDNDVMAVAGMRVAAERGVRVPEDLSIIAWDDSVLCLYTQPTLTALSHDVVEFGTQVARRLFELIDGGAASSYLVTPPQLEVRDSTGPAPRG